MLLSRADFVWVEISRELLLTPDTEFSRRELPLTDSLFSPTVALLFRDEALADPVADDPLKSFLVTLVLPDLLCPY